MVLPELLLKLLKRFRRDYLPQILGFKLSKFNVRRANDRIDMRNKTWKDFGNSNAMTPEAMMRMVARMIKRGMITVEELWPHLSPDDNEIENIIPFNVMNVKAKLK